MKHEVETGRVVAEWKYTERNLRCRCRIDDQPGTVDLTVAGEGKAFPDCLKVKAWAEAWLAANPCTAEEFCEAAVNEVGLDCFVEWCSDYHGPIRVTMSAVTNRN